MTENKSIQGVADVPGARLRYRLVGVPGAPLLVFENGWGASYEQWTWIERELAAHAQLLFYNRAGIGGSELLQAQTVTGLSDQFAALPAALGLTQPIIAVGHSYGGLMCSLHAAQRSDVLKAVVEIDPTTEVSDPVLDGNLRALGPMVRVLKLCLSMGLPNFLFGSLAKTLPDAEGKEMMIRALSKPESLDAGVAEFALLISIRSAIAKAHLSGLPRLVIGAGTTADPRGGLLSRLMSNSKRASETFERSKSLQRDRVVSDPGCQITMLPYNHSALVFEEAGAKVSAANILSFLRTIES
ncbi:alpha/beta hydrolase [Stenotrophobium rhamnosiphilum]|nr:alpha/beta hydrolase [Stenotrophobium rhamnosiphilum]